MLGAWLGVVSRAVVGAALEGKKEAGEGMEVGDWNIVQNNGSWCLLTSSFLPAFPQQRA